MKKNLVFISLVILSACCNKFLSETEIDVEFVNKINSIISDRNSTIIYSPNINSDNISLFDTAKKKHLYDYRKKFMCIFDKSKEDWNLKDESDLADLYYHEVNIDQYKKIGSFFGFYFKKLFVWEGELNSTKEIGKRNLLSRLIFSDIIVIGKVIDIKKIEIVSDIHDYLFEVTFKIDSILYSTSNYASNFETIKMIATPLEKNRIEFFEEYYNNNITSVFSFSKHFHEELLNSKHKNNLTETLLEYLHDKNTFPLGHIIKPYSITQEKYINIVEKYKIINNNINFYKSNNE